MSDLSKMQSNNESIIEQVVGVNGYFQKRKDLRINHNEKDSPDEISQR